MTNFTDHQIAQMAIQSAAHGDMIAAAVYRKAIGYDYSETDLSDLDRAYVDHLSIQECRDAALEALDD